MRTLSILSLVFLIILIALGIGIHTFAGPSASEVFTDAPHQGTLDTSGDPTVVRSRFVLVDVSLLEGASRGSVLELKLFPDVIVNLQLEERTEQAGALVLTGKVQDIPESQVILVIGGGQVAGEITLPDAIYQVRFAGDGVHAIYQIDQSAFPPEADPLSVGSSTAQNPSPQAVTGPLTDDGSVIDVLVAYTPAARAAAGGTTAMQNLVILAVAETNQAYANSGITQRINLVYQTEVVYTESGDMGTDLDRLTGKTDGYMDDLHGLRDANNADLVSLIEEASQYCGIGWQMSTVGHDFESHAFTVVARNCAAGYYSFAHELGHNMGARHDWYVDNVSDPYLYAHGYVDTSARWRTIMAYNDQCQALKFNCTRLQYFSNPSVLYGGVPMGVTGGTQPADNHLALNNTAYTVANFRARPVTSTNTPTPTRTPTSTPTPTNTSTPTNTPTNTSTPTNTPTPTPVIRLLLVDDDDNNPDVSSYYTNALNSLGVLFRTWNTNATDNEPNASQLAPYDLVVWFTGDNYSTASAGPGPAAEVALSQWLDGGGCLLLSSQDYYYRYNSVTAFMSGYLGVKSVSNDTGQTTVTGDGTTFSGLGPYTMVYPFYNYSDTITPDASASPDFTGDKGIAAIQKQTTSYWTTYWGFPFDALPTAGDRTAAMKRFLGYCPFGYHWFYLPLVRR